MEEKPEDDFVIVLIKHEAGLWFWTGEGTTTDLALAKRYSSYSDALRASGYGYDKTHHEITNEIILKAEGFIKTYASYRVKDIKNILSLPEK